MRPVMALALAALVLAQASRAAAEERTFALIVGYNGQPANADESTQPLRYADDDALAFYQLQQELGADAILLTIADAETQRRHPSAAESASSPTLVELSRALAALNARMDAAARAGDTPTFLFFYSGHGSRRQGNEPSLTFLDGGLTQSMLYARVLDVVHARLMHVIVDACHAEAVVRARDVDAKAVEITPADLAAGLSKATSARYPNVGFVIASSGSASTQEWDLYESGVFTHEVISGLRGLADVNRDRSVEYSELDAFLTAANRQVADPRARVRSVIQAPAVRQHAALSRRGPRSRSGWLTGIPGSVGQFFIEDARGNRLVDGYAEVGSSMTVAVPAAEPLFVRSREQEAELLVRAGEEKGFDILAFHGRPSRSRGAIEQSLRQGLFAMPYGPAYYSGYVDRGDGVALAVSPPALLLTSPSPASAHKKVVTWSLMGASAAFITSSLIFGALALDARHDFAATSLQREAMSASDRYTLDTTLAISFLIPGVACAVGAYFLK